MYLESVLITKTEDGKLSPYMNHQLITRSVKLRSFRYTLVVRPEMVFIYKIPSLFSKESKPQLSFSPSSKNLLIRLDEDLTDSISPSSSLSLKNASFAVLDVSEFGSTPQVELGGIIPEQESQPKADEEFQQADPASMGNNPPVEPTTTDEMNSADTTSEENSTTSESPAASKPATEAAEEKTQEKNPEGSPETTN
ncbi:MAG: hypothetical protein GY786_03295 [Proteobacteria bacterium]|nr:hypothetical protein [Pseudomonadota bacterium]